MNGRGADAGGGRAETLAERQAGLVAALTAGAPVPEGFDGRLVGVARVALLRKRAGDVAWQWPLLAAGHGAEWTGTFARWAARRPTNGSLRDGWDFARELGAALPALAGAELAAREAEWRYDGTSAPRRRRGPAVRRAGGVVAVQIAGRVRVLRRTPAAGRA
ncbi:hypothetical protein [Jidongwangia harbinensis]|uniref:hypothetical protein n=1 Tax=Jidongwangia harbinensis TaxID=2878561 RepID=UPI001CD9A87C|nr:hypothetical protein [Jidongwangia harbinensis]MCA2212234.1 hypothetical protein [Jidongwangia harbinensis]